MEQWLQRIRADNQTDLLAGLQAWYAAKDTFSKVSFDSEPKIFLFSVLLVISVSQ